MARNSHLVSRLCGHWHVIQDGRRDPDLTDAFRLAVAARALSTQRKVATFFERFLNFSCFENEPSDAFVQEEFVHARTRIESFLEASGYEIVDRDREDDSKLVRIGDATTISALPCCLKALSRVYGRLSARGLRPRANPCKIDNWHLLDPELRRELEETIYGRRLEYRSYAGSQFIVSAAPHYPLRMEDPVGLGARVLAAGKAFGWPDAIVDQVTIMDEEGARWVDTYDLHAEDWALASGFGRSIQAPNKGSNGKRVKRLVISAETMNQLKTSFDKNPDRPDFSKLQELLKARDMDALRAIPLFPARTGRPFSYHTFNNEYFRPAMEEGNVTIRSETNIAIATGHRLRAGRLQEEAEHIYRDGRSDQEIARDEKRLMEDMHLKSEAALNRYIARPRLKRAETMKARRNEERLARRAASASSPAGSTTPDLEQSDIERRLAALR